MLNYLFYSHCEAAAASSAAAVLALLAAAAVVLAYIGFAAVKL